jgi:oligopeptide transport system ATP-binding protein
MSEALLELRDLGIVHDTRAGPIRTLAGVGLSLAPRASLGLVGESGAGKSQLALAILGLLPAGARCEGEIVYAGESLLLASPAARAALRGRELALVGQDTQVSLAPHLRIRTQLRDVLETHRGLQGGAVEREALRLLDQVRIPDAAARSAAYPHELSGGLRQRVAIALALASRPRLLIADEPTTALDVIIERELLDLFAELKRELALLFISHDLAVVASLCDRVAVLYGGRLVEENEARAFYRAPHHPYARDLLAAARSGARMPRAEPAPDGCRYRSRCSEAGADCQVAPPLTGEGARIACHRPLGSAP